VSSVNKDKGLSNGAAPLFIACQESHLEVEKQFIESGVDKDKLQQLQVLGRCRRTLDPAAVISTTSTSPPPRALAGGTRPVHKALLKTEPQS
jgi:hypothetical protein